MKDKRSMLFKGALFLAVITVGMLSAYDDYLSPIVFEANGKVADIEWRTNNHDMPLFKIMEQNGSIKEWRHYRVTLEPSNIKIGDGFVKKKGSKFCTVNNVSLVCVN